MTLALGFAVGFGLAALGRRVIEWRRRRAGEDAWRDLVAWHDQQLALERLRKRPR